MGLHGGWLVVAPWYQQAVNDIADDQQRGLVPVCQYTMRITSTEEIHTQKKNEMVGKMATIPKDVRLKISPRLVRCELSFYMVSTAPSTRTL